MAIGHQPAKPNVTVSTTPVTTPTAEQSQTTLFDQLAEPLVYFLLGSAFTMTVFAMGKVVTNLIHAYNTPRSKRKPVLINWILVCFNVAVMINMVSCIPLNAKVGQDTAAGCLSLNLIQNMTYHFFIILFDYFILLKSYMVVRRAKLYLFVAGLALFNRFAWAVADLKWSGGQWIDESPAVSFSRHYYRRHWNHRCIVWLLCLGIPFTSMDYPVFPTCERESLSIFVSVHALNLRSVFRTALTLTSNVVFIYITSIPNVNILIIFVSSLFCEIIVIFFMNMELHWFQARSKASGVALGAAQDPTVAQENKPDEDVTNDSKQKLNRGSSLVRNSTLKAHISSSRRDTLQ